MKISFSRFKVLFIAVFLLGILPKAYALPKEISSINIGDINYASVEENENAQSLPIPTRINEIIYPTLGFPSLVFKGKKLSIILQLNDMQKEAIHSKNFADLSVEVMLSPKLGQVVERQVPRGFEQHFENYHQFIEHESPSIKSKKKWFRPLIVTRYREAHKMQFNLRARFIEHRFYQDKLVLVVSLPEEIPDLYHRVLDLDVKIKNKETLLLHDIQYNAVGLLKDKKKFRFVHMADPQINNASFKVQKNDDAKHPDLYNQEFGLLQAIDELNFIKPDFAFISGDLTEGGNSFHSFDGVAPFFTAINIVFPNYGEKLRLEKSSYWNEYGSITKFLRQLSFPVFSAVGNHDGLAVYERMNKAQKKLDIPFSDVLVGKDKEPLLFDGKHFWQKILGPRYYSFDFGNLHFVILDTYDLRRYFRLGYMNFASNGGGWISKEQMRWLKLDLQTATQAGKKIMLVGHHDPRGGVAGMYYDDPHYRYPRRKVLPFDRELMHLLNKYNEDELFASQEWVGAASQVSEVNALDQGYDSAKELLDLIAKNNVTHFFLGHVHADFTDVVELGGRRVNFIHSTALTAFPNPARHKDDYVSAPGHGPGNDPHWGYRVFELDQAGYVEEVFSKKDPNIKTHASHRSLELGNLRLSRGVPDFYRRRTKGIWSAMRPRALWLPYGNFMKKLEDQNLLPWLFRHSDPVVLFRALQKPALNELSNDLFKNDIWNEDLKNIFALNIDKHFSSTKDTLGKVHKPNSALFLNDNDLSIDGVLEFYTARNFSNEIEAQWMVEDPQQIRLSPIAYQKIKPHQEVINGPRWVSMPIKLPGSYEQKIYVDISF